MNLWLEDSLSVLVCLNSVLQCVDLHNRDHVLKKCVLIINLEVKDNHEEAAVGARHALDLCQEVCIWILLELDSNSTLKTLIDLPFSWPRLMRPSHGRNQLTTFWMLSRSSIGGRYCIASHITETVVTGKHFNYQFNFCWYSFSINH